MTLPNSALFCRERRDGCWTEAVKMAREAKLLDEARLRDAKAQKRTAILTEFPKWTPEPFLDDEGPILNTHHVINHGMKDFGVNMCNKPAVAYAQIGEGRRRPLVKAEHDSRINVLQTYMGSGPRSRSLGALVREDPKKLNAAFVLGRAQSQVEMQWKAQREMVQSVTSL